LVIAGSLLEEVKLALADVHDPEIPAISIVDLGIVHAVDFDLGSRAIRVELLPTFVGCPALDAIRDAVERRLAAFDREVDVRFVFTVPWTSDRITAAGHDALRRSGFAPPSGSLAVGAPLVFLETPVPCPFCGSARTRLENAFGPARCRSIRYCMSCRQPFEQVKDS
jgi:ring-1,2-phenylacetyl-CoA epoxidase subunit PaaD